MFLGLWLLRELMKNTTQCDVKGGAIPGYLISSIFYLPGSFPNLAHHWKKSQIINILFPKLWFNRGVKNMKLLFNMRCLSLLSFLDTWKWKRCSVLSILHVVTVVNLRIILGWWLHAEWLCSCLLVYCSPVTWIALCFLFFVCNLERVSKVKMFSLCSPWSVTVMFPFSFKHSLIFLIAFPQCRYCSAYRNKIFVHGLIRILYDP